ncbi:MAG: TatD family hydrolase [Bacillota bacterium]|nr:TatD family hydrolase [Bacillota bacterium]MDW7678813.1 TatD family hydrolase [Bacillota bacterium]
MFFDSHAHLGDHQYHDDQADTIQRAADAGVSLILNPGADMESSAKAIRLAQRYEGIYAGVGMHPHDVKDMKPGDLDQLEAWTKEPKVMAIGEIGLDYHYHFSPKEDQQRWFREQLQLANRLNLPVIIHDREAHGEVFEMIEAAGVAGSGCVMHCYSGSVEMAREYVKRGIYLSLAGPVTFHNARKTREVAAEIPLEWLLIETDCPYLAPVPHRGRRNEPAYVVKVAEAIAAVKNVTLEEVARQTMANAKKLFRIP